MPSPLSYGHGDIDAVAYWLVHYRRMTPGLGSAGDATTILGDDDEGQPDQQLRILCGAGRRDADRRRLRLRASRADRRDRQVEPGLRPRPEEAILRAGVREYLVLGVEPEEVRWFNLRDGRYSERPPGADSLYRSATFPGLWLDTTSLFGGDFDALIAALDRGLATPEHATFVARLATAGPG